MVYWGERRSTNRSKGSPSKGGLFGGKIMAPLRGWECRSGCYKYAFSRWFHVVFAHFVPLVHVVDLAVSFQSIVHVVITYFRTPQMPCKVVSSYLTYIHLS